MADKKLPSARTDLGGVNKELTNLEFMNPGKKAVVAAREEISKRDKKKLDAFIRREEQTLRATLKEDIGSAKKRCSRSSSSNPGMYDSRGRMSTSDGEIDICDCQVSYCEGCWTSCKECGSNKCGPVCRCNRRWQYYSRTQVEDRQSVTKHMNNGRSWSVD